MPLNSKTIENIYKGKLASKYDYSLPPFFIRWKRKAFQASSMKKGDRVLVFCCGTGLDFQHILNIIGDEGYITGVDFSPEMLKQASEKIKKNRWINIELLEVDITKLAEPLGDKFDVGVCTLGMSIIPDYQAAYYNLVANVKNQGEIIIGDMQLASGWLARFNPFTIFLAKKFGGTHEGHKNSLELCSIMKNELSEVSKREFFFKAYFYCIGKKKSDNWFI